MRRESYIVLEATVNEMPAVVLIAEGIFKENGEGAEFYFRPGCRDAHVAGRATLETDAEFLPFSLVHPAPKP